jgi:hypothetical protein
MKTVITQVIFVCFPYIFSQPTTNLNPNRQSSSVLSVLFLTITSPEANLGSSLVRVLKSFDFSF